MLKILLFHLWQRTGSDHLLFSSVVEADRRFRDCARRRFQRRIQRATGLCRCHLYLRCSFSGLWLFWNRQTFSLWYRIACNLIFNQSRCSWRIFRRNCRPGFIHYPNLFIGRFRGGYAICYLSKWTKMSINSIINWKWRNIFTLSIPREGFATFGGFLGMKRSLMTTSEPFVRSLKMTVRSKWLEWHGGALTTLATTSEWLLKREFWMFLRENSSLFSLPNVTSLFLCFLINSYTFKTENATE